MRKQEIVDYERHLAYLRKHEILFSELSEQEMESLSIFDEYELEKSYFRAGGYDVEVKNALVVKILFSVPTIFINFFKYHLSSLSNSSLSL